MTADELARVAEARRWRVTRGRVECRNGLIVPDGEGLRVEVEGHPWVVARLKRTAGVTARTLRLGGCGTFTAAVAQLDAVAQLLRPYRRQGARDGQLRNLITAGEATRFRRRQPDRPNEGGQAP
jgi:hypothetical protein